MVCAECTPTAAARATRARRRDARGRFHRRPVRRHDEDVATRGREGNGDDGEARRATRRRPPRRNAPALVFIIVGGVAAVAVAFVLARAAVEAAKSRMRVVPLAVRGIDPDAAAEAEGVLMLIGASAARRTAAGWAVIDALFADGPGLRQEDVAARLGITQQAVSQRLRTALWSEEIAARPAAARLLSLAARTGEDRDVRATTPDTVRPPERS